MSGKTNSPVSFLASLLHLPQKGMPVTIEANDAQRAALAHDHDLLDVRKFRAELVVANWKRDGVSVSGRVMGDIVQACVATLEPIEAHVEETVSAVFVPETSNLARLDPATGGEMLLDAEGPDSPEIFAGTTIDVGALAEEIFALGIDPYPRKEGASLAVDSVTDEGNEPFGILAEKLAALKREG